MKTKLEYLISTLFDLNLHYRCLSALSYINGVSSSIHINDVSTDEKHILLDFTSRPCSPILEERFDLTNFQYQRYIME